MKIGITGSSGMIGTYLTYKFEEQNVQVVRLTRSITSDEIKDLDVIINLAGANINRRWTKKGKKQIYDSRIITTRRLVNSINALDSKPKLLISTSATGFYKSFTNSNDVKQQSETNYLSGDNFLHEVCDNWEQEAKMVKDTRLVIVRLGVVLSRDGGVLKKLLLPAKFGIGAWFGKGDQKISWICMPDIYSAIKTFIENENYSGAYNLTSPKTITLKNLVNYTLKKKINIKLSIPKIFAKLAMGESSSLILESQEIIPLRLLESGYVFNCEDLNSSNL